MNRIIARSFGGLRGEFYLRQLVFGVAIAAVMFWMKTLGRPATSSLLIVLTVNALLYPYARFVWISICDFILGETVLYLPAAIVLFAKLVTMFFCFTLAVLIAPLGLLYLYLSHDRRARLR